MLSIHMNYIGTLKPEALPTIHHQFHSYAGEHLAEEQMLQDKQKLVHQQPEIIQHQEEIVNQHSQQESEVPIEHNYCVQQSEKPLQYLLDKYQQFLPHHWAYIPKPDGIEYIRLDPETRLIKNHIMVKDDLTVLVIFPNKERLHVDDQIVSSLPEDVYAYLKSVEKWPLSVIIQIENQRKDVKELLLDMECIKECNKIFDVNHVESSERNSMIERVAIVSRKNGLYLSVRRVVR